MARWGIPGLGVGIVEGDEMLYARGFGVQSLDTSAPVTPESVFCVASVTKCFVATAVMQLVEQGQIDLDAPASFLHSTVVDMCHWGTTCLQRGTFAGRHLLSPASCEIMWAPVAERGYPPLYEHTGLGWTLGHFEGVRTVSHGGMGLGWTDFFTILMEKNRAAVILCNEESSARSRTIQAALHTILDMPPQVGAVSWMIPINQALIEGGIQAAYACYERLKDSALEEYFFEADELITLMYQLVSVGQIDLAIDLLRLNLHAFPEHIDSYLYLANLCLKEGKPEQAEEALSKALSLQPDNPVIIEQLQKLRSK